MVKIIAPVELELVMVLIVGEHLHVVVEDEPWHIMRIEAGTPRMESWRPEVHPQTLRLVHMLDSWVMEVYVAHFMTIHRP